MRIIGSSRLVHSTLLFVTLGGALTAAGEWPGWRGPNQDGISTERGLPERWSPEGENLAWKAPFGGRSGPIVIGRRLCAQNTAGKSTNWSMAEDLQERVMCLDADTGHVLWEHRFSVGLTDVPPHRVGWASPVADPETGNLYAFGAAGRLMGLSPDGRLLWERSLVEEYGAVTTHGGRTVSPIVEGDLVIVNTLLSAWGPWARGGNRYLAFDKRTGQSVWIASPQTRHYDTNYAMPVATTVAGQRLIIVGGTDGGIHAMKVNTGESVWNWDVSKRAINTSIVMHGTTAIVTHSEENLDSNEMGMIAAVDAAATGTIAPEQIKWRVLGWQGGFSTPVIDGDRLYQVDNGAVLGAFDLGNGSRLWRHGLGTIQKASLVFGDGKLYVGTENGKFFILRPGPSGVEVLDQDQLGRADDPEQIIASAAIANGRVYVVSDRAIYAIGKGSASRTSAGDGARGTAADGAGAPPAGGPAESASWLQVVPADALVRPGEKVKFVARLFDAKGHPLASAPATWAVEGMTGTVSSDGTYTAPTDSPAQAGSVKAVIGGVSGAGQVRVIPPLPWNEDFDATSGEAPPKPWINATGKFVVREVDGNKALFRLEDVTVTRRARLFMGPWTLSNYTVEVDVRAIERRRQLADVGVFAQEYGLVLFGNAQRLELHPWQTATAMTVAAPFAWKADTWYRMKLRVENLPDGTTKVQGKAWPRDDQEPAAWAVEKLDRIPHRQGSPGLYADAPFGAWFDNIKVTPVGRPKS